MAFIEHRLVSYQWQGGADPLNPRRIHREEKTLSPADPVTGLENDSFALPWKPIIDQDIGAVTDETARRSKDVLDDESPEAAKEDSDDETEDNDENEW